MRATMKRWVVLAGLMVALPILLGLSSSGGPASGVIPGGLRNYTSGMSNPGGSNQIGSLVVTAIGSVSAPTGTAGGGASTTGYCVGLDWNGYQLLASLQSFPTGTGQTVPSSGYTQDGGTSGSPATWTCGGSAGAVGYAVLKGATNALLGICGPIISGNSCSVTDTAQSTTYYVARAYDGTQDFVDLNGSIYVGLAPGGLNEHPNSVVLGPGPSGSHLWWGDSFNIYNDSGGLELTGAPINIDQQYTVATLPATCLLGQLVTVTNATSVTAGTCVGGGTTYVLAMCSGTNTWSCL